MQIDFKKISDLRQEIKKLIAEKPELQELQDEIDAALEKAGNDHQRRNQVIQEMMLNSWFRITNLDQEVENQRQLDALPQRLAERPRLRCKGKDCDMRKGFWVWKEQKELMLKKKCLMCGSDVVELNPVEETNDNNEGEDG